MKYKHTIEEMRDIALTKNGKCLSDEYLGYDNVLQWKCSENHIWEKAPRYIFRGHWCVKCSRYKRQHFCNYVFEIMCDRVFKTIKHKFEEYEFPLEIDGYNKDINIGFEYQGIQHYEITAYSKNNEYLKEIQYRDNLKKILFEKYNFNILVIKYTMEDIEIVNKIRDFLNINNIKIVNNNINIIEFYNKYNYLTEKIKEVGNIIKTKNGELLSYDFSTCKVKCDNNHIWETKQYIIKKGHWCPTCSNNDYNRYTFMKNKLSKSNITLITKEDEYKICDLLKIECNVNHISFIDKEKLSNKLSQKRLICSECVRVNRINSSILKMKEIEINFNVKFDFDSYKNKNSIITMKCNIDFKDCYKNISERLRKNKKICLKCKKNEKYYEK